MTRLDRYVVTRQLGCLALSALSMWLVAVVVDLVENIDTFIDHEASLASIGRYYLYRTPYWILLTLPVTTLLGTLFCLTGLARCSEIVAVNAAGIGVHRMLAPLHLLSFTLSGAFLWFTDAVVPPATFRYNATRDEIRSYSRTDGSRRHVLLSDVDGQFLFARSYDNQRRRAHEVTWERTRGSHTLERATARVAAWDSAASRWVLEGGHYYALDGERPAVAAFDTLALSRLTLGPDDLARQRKEPEEMDFAELAGAIRRARAAGEDVSRNLVDLHLKLAFPFTCVVTFLLGAPLATGARRSGRAGAFGLGVLVCFAFYGAVQVGRALGWNGLIDPWLGAWLANLVFAGLGLLLLRQAHT